MKAQTIEKTNNNKNKPQNKLKRSTSDLFSICCFVCFLCVFGFIDCMTSSKDPQGSPKDPKSSRRGLQKLQEAPGEPWRPKPSTKTPNQKNNKSQTHLKRSPSDLFNMLSVLRCLCVFWRFLDGLDLFT